jgi:uncharacterized protein (TIGR04255 family)
MNMGLVLPDIERVVFEKNQLDSVICQLRFPPILQIETDLPSTFQARIRDTYVEYRPRVEYRQEIGMRFQNLQAPNVSTSESKIHDFISADEKWIISLARTYIALTSKKYTRWEEFIRNFTAPFDALNSIDIYKPLYFTRIGLRYVNVFRRSALGLKESPWDKLMNKEILGLLASDLSLNIRDLTDTCIINIDPVSNIRLSMSMINEPTEQCLRLDGDFSIAAIIEPTEVLAKLEYLHDYAKKLFRWTITPALFQAMEPTNDCK